MSVPLSCVFSAKYLNMNSPLQPICQPKALLISSSVLSLPKAKLCAIRLISLLAFNFFCRDSHTFCPWMLCCRNGCWTQCNFLECKHSSPLAPDGQAMRHIPYRSGRYLYSCCLIRSWSPGGDECVHAVVVFRANVLLSGRGLISCRVGTP